MDKKICIHGHFYQPQRENPWTGVIEREHAAAPWHDWNERICDECYRPNTAARLLDRQGLVSRISLTYSRISFDFGPTLLSWLERQEPLVYEDILRADARAAERFSGHGSAIAHPYHHLILPLLPPPDQETEVRWGIRDFEHRFGRFPEGMWLPEMAADTGTLSVLADHGISFVLLAPHQACRVRYNGDSDWTDSPDGSIDTTVPYRCPLPGGSEIAVFFHDAATSTALAFGDLLENGDTFAGHLLSTPPGTGMLSCVTDGETFGHHHRFGEMALGWCLERLESSHPGTLTVYGEYLATNPPEHEVMIAGRTSWSCSHGVRRWDDGCTCGSGRHPGWSHEWRGPLRAAIRELAESLAGIYTREAAALFADPLAAREESIRICHDRSPGSLDRFFREHARRTLDHDERAKALALLEMSWQGLAMQTSCAWFFDDIADREAVQVLRHAARAIQLAADQAGEDLEPPFISRLPAIPGNRPGFPEGGVVYRECVRPLVLRPEEQAACLALIASARGEGTLLSENPYSGDFLSTGDVTPVHDLSLAGSSIQYILMGSGTTSVLLGISHTADTRPGTAPERLLRILRKNGYDAAAAELRAACPVVFSSDDLPPAARKLAIAPHLLRVTSVLTGAAGVLHDRYSGILGGEGIPPPDSPAISRLAWYVLLDRIGQVLASPDSSPGDLGRLAADLATWGIGAVPPALTPPAGQFVRRLMGEWTSCPEERSRLDRVIRALALLEDIGIPYPVWHLQNEFIGVRDGTARLQRDAARAGDMVAAAWWDNFRHLGAILRVSVE